MAGCQVKKGFFLLFDCDAPADLKCRDCGRYICREHGESDVPGEGIVCYDCWAKRQQSIDVDVSSTGGAWFHRFRTGFYRSTRYGPINFGSTSVSDTYYDEFDVRSFDPGPDGGAVEDSDSGSVPDGGFDS
ncbi:MAG: hypothetical protein HQM09_05900 [Candidatus Riflebacteria bacterium]|nr:hypothetical protein [Candidatus Riflebacteria bacterium]